MDKIHIRILERGYWESHIPPVVHAPLVQAYVYRGTAERTLRDKAALSDVLRVARGDIVLQSIQDEEFLLLENITSLKVQQTLTVASGGSAQLTVTDPLVRKQRKDGSYVWTHMLAGDTPMVYKGATVHFLSRFDGDIDKIHDPNYHGAPWFEGELQVDPEDLANTNDILWKGTGPTEQTCTVEHLHLASVGTGLQLEHSNMLEPMMKLKMFAGARFQPTNIGKDALDTLMRELLEGQQLPTDEVLDLDGAVSERLMVPLFTGYLRRVSGHYSGGVAMVDLNIQDVLVWLDLSNINLNPSFDIVNVEPLTAEQIRRAGNQIWTTYLAGLRADEVVRQIFVGRPTVMVRAGTDLFQSSTGGARIGTIIADRASVTIRGTDPSTRDVTDLNELGRVEIRAYFVITYDGRLGWVMAEQVERETLQLFGGVGEFFEIADIAAGNVSGVISSSPQAQEVRNLFSGGDRLIIFPALEPHDEVVLEVYRRYFKQNWNLFQSEYRTRREILREVTTKTHTELYADPDGRVWFHPVWGYRDVLSVPYIMQPEEVISFAFTESDEELCTWIDVVGEVDWGIPSPPFLFRRAISLDTDLMQRYGVRAISIHNPNIRTAAAASTFGRSMLQRLNAQRLQGEVTLIFRPELRLARNVYVPWLDRVYYIHSISHNVHWGQTATTTLGLKYGRAPWEPWYPLSYAESSESSVARTGVTSFEIEEPIVGVPTGGMGTGWTNRYGGKSWRITSEGFIEVAEGKEITRPFLEHLPTRSTGVLAAVLAFSNSPRFNISATMILATAYTESTANVNVPPQVLPGGDYVVGIMQVRLSTARELAGDPTLTVEQLQELQRNIELGTHYLSVKQAEVGADPVLLAVSYNAGSVREDLSNPWHMRMDTAHVDRFIKYYNTILRDTFNVSGE